MSEPPEPPVPDPIPSPSAPPEEEAGASALRQFLGLFVVPLLVVLLCVAVFIGFGWIAHDKQTTSDCLNDLRSGWKPRRTQAAYELSKILIADPHALDEEPGAKAEVRTLFTEAQEPELKQYLALVLGRTHDRQAVPLLVAALGSPDAKTRIYSLWALGVLGDPAARGPLAAALADRDAGIRKTAAFALGELGDRAAVPSLVPRLDDAVADVRWNAALSLARLGSRAGVPVLETMLDRRLLAQVPDISREQQEEAMISALQALSALNEKAELPLLDRLAAGDPSLKVRQAAISAREEMAKRSGTKPSA
ncbi:MAG TPA: HEAT repeat domain-containing protein [Thermoanaerobaculia bacterium]|nr:HEAT repeat domain-containing protein [Thermoanaerobaculia bacterium]